MKSGCDVDLSCRPLDYKSIPWSVGSFTGDDKDAVRRIDRIDHSAAALVVDDRIIEYFSVFPIKSRKFRDSSAVSLVRFTSQKQPSRRKWGVTLRGRCQFHCPNFRSDSPLWWLVLDSIHDGVGRVVDCGL